MNVSIRTSSTFERTGRNDGARPPAGPHLGHLASRFSPSALDVPLVGVDERAVGEVVVHRPPVQVLVLAVVAGEGVAGRAGNRAGKEVIPVGSRSKRLASVVLEAAAAPR